MSFAQAVQTCFRKYAVFSGRATRSEYWWWQLFVFLGGTVLAIVEFAADVEALGALFGLATWVPGLAVSVRRLHDTGRSAWWLLVFQTAPAIAIALLGSTLLAWAQGRVPALEDIIFVGFTALGLILANLAYQIYILTRESEWGDNDYGPQPGRARIEVA